MKPRKIVSDRHYYVNDDGSVERGSQRRIIKEADYRYLRRTEKSAIDALALLDSLELPTYGVKRAEALRHALGGKR